MLSEAFKPSKISRRGVLAGFPMIFTPKVTAQESKPNVLILYSDDQRADTIGAWGNRYIDTPNLDRLVRRGVSFRSCYNQGGHQGAVCIASRAMLLSGKSLWRATAGSGLDGTLLPERFREAGYNTFFTGKWHNGQKTLERCFQSGGLTHLVGMGPHVQPSLGKFGEFKAEARDGRATPLFADGLVDYLSQQMNQKSPFFAYCAFTAPHDPREATAEDKKRYESRELPLPRPWYASPQRNNGELVIRDEMVVPAPRTREQCRSELAAYYGLITEMDRNIGRILKALEDSGQLDRTMIVFAGDNGLAMGAHGLMGKQSMYEHSLRVPLIMAGPGMRRGTESRPMYLYEVYSRLCSHLSLAVPKGVEKPGAPLYFGYRTFQRAVRLGKHKMAWSGKSLEQYDLGVDPYEEHNLYATSQGWPEAEFLKARRTACAHFGDPVEVPA
jgi:arylsulfatase A-like enzyme